MDATLFLSILGASVSICGTVVGVGVWIGRKVERIDNRFEIGEVRMTRHSQRLNKHQAELQAHRMQIDRLERPGATGGQGGLRPTNG